MNIVKASESLQKRVEQGIVAEDESFLDACKLGSEALKAYEAFRSGEGEFHYPLLPGETED